MAHYATKRSPHEMRSETKEILELYCYGFISKWHKIIDSCYFESLLLPVYCTITARALRICRKIDIS